MRQMSVLSEGEGLFIMGWMGKGKKSGTKEASEREPAARLGSFLQPPQASVASAHPLCVCKLVGTTVRPKPHMHAHREGRTETGRWVFSFLDASGTWRRLCAASFFSPGKQTKTRTWRHFNPPVLF